MCIHNYEINLSTYSPERFCTISPLIGKYIKCSDQKVSKYALRTIPPVLKRYAKGWG